MHAAVRRPDRGARFAERAHAGAVTGMRRRHRIGASLGVGVNAFTAAVALFVFAVCLTGATAASWWSAEHDEEVLRGAARQEALLAGEQVVAAFNTLDYRRVDEGFDRWLALSTGPLHEELSRQRRDGRERLVATAAVTEARVLDAAVTELDERAGTATVIASVEVVVTRDGAPPEPKHDRIQAGLTRTESGWKVSWIGQVPIAVL
ncbi:hypothetical protein N599_30770 [Saccharopolyspora erythraea D]|nr:hypothetical protein N599_30770 [Saccharopolyspora erythraea D]